MLLSQKGIDLENWKAELDSNGTPLDLKSFGEHLSHSYIPNTAVVDCTASDQPATFYHTWMQQVNIQSNFCCRNACRMLFKRCFQLNVPCGVASKAQPVPPYGSLCFQLEL